MPLRECALRKYSRKIQAEGMFIALSALRLPKERLLYSGGSGRNCVEKREKTRVTACVHVSVRCT